VYFGLQRIEPTWPATGLGSWPAGQGGQPRCDWSKPVQIEAIDPAPPDEFVMDQASLPEHPEMPADGRPGDGKERRHLAGAEIAAGQGGHHLSAGGVSERGEHFHD
jgi:hypothetical protein